MAIAAEYLELFQKIFVIRAFSFPLSLRLSLMLIYVYALWGRYHPRIFWAQKKEEGFRPPPSSTDILSRLARNRGIDGSLHNAQYASVVLAHLSTVP